MMFACESEETMFRKKEMLSEILLRGELIDRLQKQIDLQLQLIAKQKEHIETLDEVNLELNNLLNDILHPEE